MNIWVWTWVLGYEHQEISIQAYEIWDSKYKYHKFSIYIIIIFFQKNK